MKDLQPAGIDEGGNIADEWPNVIHGAGGG